MSRAEQKGGEEKSLSLPSRLLNKIPSATRFCESLFVSPQAHVHVRNSHRRSFFLKFDAESSPCSSLRDAVQRHNFVQRPQDRLRNDSYIDITIDT